MKPIYRDTWNDLPGCIIQSDPFIEYAESDNWAVKLGVVKRAPFLFRVRQDYGLKLMDSRAIIKNV